MDVLIRAANALVMMGLPLALGVVLVRRLGVSWGLFGVGAATFIGSQVLHIPFNAWVLTPSLPPLGLSDASQGWPLAAVALLLGLSAGLFEEGARALVYRTWLRKARSWSEAVMFGAGHGGIEAVVLGGLALYGLIQAVALREADLVGVVPPDQVEAARAQIAAYWQLPWHMAILGAVERAGALCIQVGLAVLVMQAFTRRKAIWWFVAVGWHTVVDGLAVYALPTWGAYVTEGLVAVCALVSVGAIIVLRPPKAELHDEQRIADAMPAHVPAAGEPVASKERLDNSRFVD